MMVDLRPCAHCGAEFTAYRLWQRFCGGKCRKDHWEAEHPRITRRPRPIPQPEVRAMVAALRSLRSEP